ncbi:high mobility group box, partial [Cylindrobasidium torrendii FP15055 ss-10]
IKRPSNAFFLYRSEMCKELRALGDQKDVSKVVGQMWRALSPAEKQPWKDRAEEEKRKHSEQNPTYKFKP